MKSYIVHYRNKYPGGRVDASETSIDAYDSYGRHRVALRKNGAGQWICHSEEFGCLDRHDLAPIPKNSRVWKHYKDGKIGPSEEASERFEDSKLLHVNGRIPSLKEFQDRGAPVNELGEVTLKQKIAAPPRDVEEVLSDLQKEAGDEGFHGKVKADSDSADGGFAD